ncbi:YitT family protein [Bisgaard Taxon 10/6]|uniref:membrane protein YczE n=1 Tax=Exercitatus varius TaxID=67857 RepID=UPI00294AEBC1|nr:YitT family protein [Exercitatus varius]MDG2915506.1 YitT family protein [Exercitatus varius]MDG2943414.1 YitT family protein [Exercitatus varius]MDG2953951.1 YitT family protein [Exercitatus varius]MDG2958268.1 YitT family protein [Exercitatus varius]MDG2960795.1 YitT family protein [Exercitatus varius]
MSKFKVLPQTPWTAMSLWSLEWRSLAMLCMSLTIVGIGEGLLLLSDLGSAPWTILSQGISLQCGISVGWASFFISVIVMLFWFPLKLHMGLGTILNIVVIAIFLGVTVKTAPLPVALWSRFAYVLFGIFCFGVGSAIYLTCHQGAGPRDGLMVGLCQRFHWKVGIVRTCIEVTVCFLGFCLGGTVGVGTLIFALSIGWTVQFTLAQVARFSR